MTSDTFAARLIALREAQGWSRYRLAKLCGVSAAHLGRLEAGAREPSLAVAQRIADALGQRLAVFEAPGR